MAFSAHQTQRAMEELRDDPATFHSKVDQVVGLIRASRRTVVFTGAGISTSAGIPDYRGPQGVWTLAATGQRRTEPTTDMACAIPTPTHMAIVQLLRNDLAHYVVSQNVDGLHRRSGVRANQIAELHGNTNVEVCVDCGKQYFRDYCVSSMARDHSTGQVCEMPGCGGALRDNIINFGENLEPAILTEAFRQSQQAILHICLGSSLTVCPANEMPRSTKECGGKLVIVNLQRTPLDNICDVRVHGPVDAFMSAVMEGLSLPIPPFELHRRIVAWRSEGTLFVSGVEEDGHPHTIIDQVLVNGVPVGKGPALPIALGKVGVPQGRDVDLECTFFGHYHEPSVTLRFPYAQSVISFDLILNPLARSSEWKVTPATYRPPDFACRATRGVDAAALRVPTMPPLQDYAGWHAVDPIEDCPHLYQVQFHPNQMVDLNTPCHVCSNVGENMICMACGVVACGRHVSGHMVQHSEESGHVVVCGMLDISFWCYACEAYINPRNKKVRQHYAAVHCAKFGSIPWA